MMPYMKKEKFKQTLKNNEFDKVYILFGNEFFIVNNYAERLIKVAISDEFIDFNFTKLDGDTFSLDDLQNALSTFAVLSEHRVVLLKNLCYSKFSKISDFKKFEQIINSMASTSILIITIFIETFDYSQLKKFKAWLKNFEKLAQIIDCSASSNTELFIFFSSLIKKLGSSINQVNFNFLINRVSKNWLIVFNEIEKLSAYAYGREITKNDILNLTNVNLSFTAFELANEILQSNVKRAVEILNNLIKLDVNLFLICGAINSSFIDLYRVFVCVKNGLTDENIAKLFGYRGSDFRIRNSRQIARKFNIEKLRRCIEILSDLDLSLKTMVVDKQILVEQAIVKMTTI